MLYIAGYILIAILTGLGIKKVLRGYYTLNDDSDKFLVGICSTFWFFGLPMFLWKFHKEINSVLHGRDWEDDNIEDLEAREQFRAREKDVA